MSQGVEPKLQRKGKNVELRVAGPNDRQGLLQLLPAQFEEHHIPLLDEKLAQGVDGVLDEPTRGLFLLAFMNGETVGVAYLAFTWTLEHGGMSAWLEELYVRPEQRQQGVGRAMLDAVCRMAKEHGCAAVDLEVEASQSRAEHLYQRAGFRSHRRRRWVKVL